jgi:hypothetical protein
MKKIKLLLGLALCVSIITFAGCVTKTPGTGVSGVPAAYTPDTNRISQTQATVNGVIAALPPSPYTTAGSVAVNAGFAIFGAISGLVAMLKTKQAASANAAAGALAAGVVAAGPGVASAVVEHASTGPQAAAVFDHINDATPQGSPTIATPKT